jgi:hypothetical protein
MTLTSNGIKVSKRETRNSPSSRWRNRTTSTTPSTWLLAVVLIVRREFVSNFAFVFRPTVQLFNWIRTMLLLWKHNRLEMVAVLGPNEALPYYICCCYKYTCFVFHWLPCDEELLACLRQTTDYVYYFWSLYLKFYVGSKDRDRSGDR